MDVNAAPAVPAGNNWGCGGGGAVGNPVIGKFGPNVCNVNCPVCVAANCACVGSGGGEGMVVGKVGDKGGVSAGVGDGVSVGVGAVVGVAGTGTPVNEGANANCAGVGKGGGGGMADAGVGVDVGMAGAGAGVGNTVAVPKGRVPKEASPVANVAVGAGANGVGVSALPLGSFPNNLINTVLSSDSPNVSLDFCHLGIVFCT